MDVIYDPSFTDELTIEYQGHALFKVRPLYSAIRQRIDLMCMMTHLDRAQTEEYVKQHLTYAGVEREIFSDGALNEIFQFSSGVARLINKACTHCLMYGAQNGYRIIDDHMVKRVVQGELS